MPVLTLTVTVAGLSADVEFNDIETPRDVIHQSCASILGLCYEDGDLPEGVALRHKGAALELDRALADQDVEDGAVLTLLFPFA